MHQTTPPPSEDEIAQDGFPVRRAHAGRSYVYVLPCAGDTLLKIGYSRDPLRRFREFHRRFFEFFDLDRGAVMEAERVSEARRLERRFIERLGDWGAPAPLTVPRSAAGHTEWYRGVHDDALAFARGLSESEGYTLHEPLKPWLRGQLRERGELLYDWSRRLLEVIEYERCNPSASEFPIHLESSLRDALAMFEGLGMELEALVPASVLDWHRRGSSV